MLESAVPYWTGKWGCSSSNPATTGTSRARNASPPSSAGAHPRRATTPPEVSRSARSLSSTRSSRVSRFATVVIARLDKHVRDGSSFTSTPSASSRCCSMVDHSASEPGTPVVSSCDDESEVIALASPTDSGSGTPTAPDDSELAGGERQGRGDQRELAPPAAGGLLGEHRHRLRHRQGPREPIALAEVALQVAQLLELLDELDALRHRLQLEDAAELDDRPHDAHLLRLRSD